MTFVSFGERRFALKSNFPLKKACADNFELDIDDLNTFIVKMLGQRNNIIQRWVNLDSM